MVKENICAFDKLDAARVAKEAEAAQRAKELDEARQRYHVATNEQAYNKAIGWINTHLMRAKRDGQPGIVFKPSAALVDVEHFRVDIWKQVFATLQGMEGYATNLSKCTDEDDKPIVILFPTEAPYDVESLHPKRHFWTSLLVAVISAAFSGFFINSFVTTRMHSDSAGIGLLAILSVLVLFATVALYWDEYVTEYQPAFNLAYALNQKNSQVEKQK